MRPLLRSLLVRSVLAYGVPLRGPAVSAALGCAVLFAAGCTSSREAERVCTMEFRTVTVRVVDAQGRPVEGLAVTVRNERTGRTLDVSQEEAGGFGDGVYAVATDAHVDDVSEAGDRLAFRAVGGRGRVAEGAFVVGRDAAACHIERRSGPEQIVARAE